MHNHYYMTATSTSTSACCFHRSATDLKARQENNQYDHYIKHKLSTSKWLSHPTPQIALKTAEIRGDCKRQAQHKTHQTHLEYKIILYGEFNFISLFLSIAVTEGENLPEAWGWMRWFSSTTWENSKVKPVHRDMDARARPPYDKNDKGSFIGQQNNLFKGIAVWFMVSLLHTL